MPTQTYEGSPCRVCGATHKYVRGRACIACSKARVTRAKLDGRAAERARRYYEKHTERAKARITKWKQDNAAKTAALNASRRAAQAKRTPKWLTAEHKRQIRAFYEEAARRTRETGVKWHVDHVVPLLGRGVCGLHVPWNLQVITREDNLKKGNKLLGQGTI